MAIFEELLGKTLTSIEGEVSGYSIRFTTNEGAVYKLYHSQDCCESVDIESIFGDFEDLIGAEILQAEKVSSEETPGDVVQKYKPDSQTWTFYKLGTIKGNVTIRWHGVSNGYYSESVDFAKTA